ncbi:mannosyltransferase family protein [Alicyclobacillus sp. SO9]|uniref:mannosyltransferase family protein n=1 Tax=Alicyclobacillus sp. SO9 TaxID=2665646 RepID=UPI0018E840DE|nr:mannosyltransferase family protein [Alicyclobacillus sp. SO9]
MAVLLQRLGLFLVTVLFHFTAPHPVHIGWDQWDTTWFVHIAEHGYVKESATPFLPVYPVLIHMFHLIFRFSYRMAAQWVAVLGWILALYALARIVEVEQSPGTARWTVVFAAAFPTAFYTQVPYSEPVYLAFALWTVWMVEQNRLFFAANLMSITSLTRNTGFLVGWYIAAPAILGRIRFRRLWVFVVPLILGILYLVWSLLTFHDAFAFMDAEKVWHRTFTLPFITLLLAAEHFLPLKHVAYKTMEAVSAIWFIFVTAWLFRQRDYIHLGYALALTLIVFSAPAVSVHDYLLSVPRFTVMLWPGYWLPAVSLKAAKSKIVLAALMFLAQCSIFYIYYGGHWIA